MKTDDARRSKPIRLLLVDDEDHFRQTIAKRLTRRGLDCHQAVNGNECLSILRNKGMDVVVLDVRMPGMSGIEVLKTIRDAYPDIEVLLLTGHVTTSDGIEGIKSGAFDYLTKPVELEHLHNKILQAYDKIQRSAAEKKETEYRRQMERQMIDTERLASLGTLAAGVAHEINNPLAIIRESAGWMRQMLTKDDLTCIPRLADLTKALDKVEASVGRASLITHQLLGFVGKSGSVVSKVDLRQLAEESVRLVSHELKNRDIHIAWRMDQLPEPIESDPFRLRQVLLNLLTNAVHAVDSAGTITITIKDNGASQLITVGDTGHGIPRENLAKIFEPFFSTKPPGEGTGLGLFVTRGIVEKLGGTVEVESSVGLGTRFSVRLPKHPKKTDDIEERDVRNRIENTESRFAPGKQELRPS